MQSIPESIHHTISTLACLALAGTLAACGNNNSDNNGDGAKNTPTITFDATTDLARTYAGVSGFDFANSATVTGAGLCSGTYLPGITYSSDNTANAPVDTSGVVTYKAAGTYIITATTDEETSGDSVVCYPISSAYTLKVNKAIPTLVFNSNVLTTSLFKDETVDNQVTLGGVGGDAIGDDGRTLDGISISYSSADTAKARVDASSGEVTAKTADVTSLVITATYSGSDNYTNATASYTFSIAQLAVNSSPIKKLIFSWRDVSDAAYYKLSKVDTTGGMNAQVGQDVTASNTGGVQSITHIVPLFADAGTRYRLESCGDTSCTSSAKNADITQAQLNRAIGYIKASNTGGEDYFGYSLSLSADGTTLAVGAYEEASDATGVGNNQGEWSTMDNDNTGDAGAVYVFSRDATTDDWSQQAYIKASNTSGGDQFGYSLSLDASGTTLAVGAPYGAAYIFIRNTTTNNWTQLAYIKASNTGAGDWFGESLSLSADGTTLAVGAYLEDSSATGVGNNQTRWSEMNNGGAPDSGAVYVFTRDTSDDWSQQAYIKASNTGQYDRFGDSLSLNADGTTLAVGAYREDSDATGVGNNQGEWTDMSNDQASSAGAVYVFTRDTSDDWSQQAYIKASNTGNDDYFGGSVSLSADGTTLAVGAWGEDSDATGVGNQSNNSAASAGAGAVYVFSRDTSDDWTQQAYIKTSNTDEYDYFGQSLSLSAAGTTLAVGARNESSNAIGVYNNQSEWSTAEVGNNNSYFYAGAVYVFIRNTTTDDWSQQAYIKASNTSGGDWFGTSLSLSADGTTLAVGASGEASGATGVGGDQSNNSADEAGAVYLY